MRERLGLPPRSGLIDGESELPATSVTAYPRLRDAHTSVGGADCSLPRHRITMERLQSGSKNTGFAHRTRRVFRTSELRAAVASRMIFTVPVASCRGCLRVGVASIERKAFLSSVRQPVSAACESSFHVVLTPRLDQPIISAGVIPSPYFHVVTSVACGTAADRLQERPEFIDKAIKRRLLAEYHFVTRWWARQTHEQRDFCLSRWYCSSSECVAATTCVVKRGNHPLHSDRRAMLTYRRRAGGDEVPRWKRGTPAEAAAHGGSTVPPRMASTASTPRRDRVGSAVGVRAWMTLGSSRHTPCAVATSVVSQRHTEVCLLHFEKARLKLNARSFAVVLSRQERFSRRQVGWSRSFPAYAGMRSRLT